MTAIQASIAASEITNNVRDAVGDHVANCCSAADKAERKSGRKFTQAEYEAVWVENYFWPPKPLMK